MSVFDKAIDLQPAGDGHFQGSTVPEWANMAGPFGGITAAALIRAIQLHPQCHGQPIALTVNYVAPIADGDFDVDTKLVRTNRSNQHWIVEQSQGGEVKTTATAVLGCAATPGRMPRPRRPPHRNLTGWSRRRRR